MRRDGEPCADCGHPAYGHAHPDAYPLRTFGWCTDTEVEHMRYLTDVRGKLPRGELVGRRIMEISPAPRGGQYVIHGCTCEKFRSVPGVRNPIAA